MNIDWIHAPDWAEAVGVRLYKNGNYGYAFICPTGYNYKLELGKTAKCHPFNYGHAIGDFSIIEFRPKASAIAWTGEGLPPVGVLCEHRTGPGMNWSHATVLAYGEKKVFYRDRDGHEWTRPYSDIEFRPIRTPEQIAMDDREAKAKAMWQAIYFNTDPDYWEIAPEGTRDTFRAAIDAGWQKVPRA